MTEYRRVVRKRKKKKKSRWKKILLILLLIVLAFGGYLAYVTYNAYQQADKSYHQLSRGEKSEKREKAVQLSKDPVSILLMGVENYSTNGEGGRSDTLIVITLNPKDKSMKMLSIPRDTLVHIPGRENKTKINAAYSIGGKDLTVQTVEDFLDIPIDYYAEVSFKGFKDIVDELGGVDVNVPFAFWEHNDTNGERINFKKGMHHLNGEEALAYSRMRKRDPRGDFGRNERQKQIITAVIKKATAPQNFLQIDDIAGKVGQNVDTNLRIPEVLGFQQNYSGFSTDKIDKLKLKGTDLYTPTYYYKPDPDSVEELQKTLQDHLENKTVSIRDQENQEGTDTSGEDSSGSGAGQ
ncbi:LCP family protein [Metabacillus sp. GX 13764]|uniref:LCP family protein n=1 Tax=Metabacillus kandeliae TaxID=2900151 RepID=UPI001E4866CE|nr:LCP family protein [Metabacillus kandeliae]MCD7034461.1 LCP family protein [Metabacillus kandeliae]